MASWTSSTRTSSWSTTARRGTIGRWTTPAAAAEGNNPLCGDRITVWLKVEDGVIQDASFQGAGCAISKASASLMTAAVKGKSQEEAGRLFERFHRLVTGRLQAGEAETLGKLAVFSGVSEFPIRVKCATLSWHAMKEAMAAPASR